MRCSFCTDGVESAQTQKKSIFNGCSLSLLLAGREVCLRLAKYKFKFVFVPHPSRSHLFYGSCLAASAGSFKCLPSGECVSHWKFHILNVRHQVHGCT